MKRLLLLALLALPTLAHGARVNCTSSCTFITDPTPALPAPASCRLYAGSTLKTSSPVVAMTGGVRCQFVATFAPGTYSLTARFVDSAGNEGDPSLPLALESAVPLPAPSNLRVAP